MGRIHREAPYYDDYDANKHYSVILTKPGYGAQARENTQLQTMIYDYMSRLGDYMIKAGSIVDGCVPLINGTTFSITAGRIYLDGLIRLTEPTDLTIKGVGTEVIGCKLISEIVTSVQDASLVDPAPGFDNSGQQGADRLKEYVQFTVDDQTASVLWTLKDGEFVTTTATVEDTNPMLDILAKRTYDESGSYKVSGFELFDRKQQVDSNPVLGIGAGTAYIKGYEVFSRYATQVVLNRSLKYLSTFNEPKLFTEGVYVYLLANQPFKSVNEVSADVRYTEEVTRGNIQNGQDLLSKTPVVRIISVTAGSTTYTQGVDYTLVSNNVDWGVSASSGKIPSIGSTYTVVYEYRKLLEQNKDFSITSTNDIFYLHLISSGSLPVPNSRIEISYDFYLARKDLICLDQYGNFKVFEGESDVINRCEAPLNKDSSLLPLGSVLLKPNSNTFIVNNYKNYRLTMEEIYNISKRVDDVEFNMAVTDLDTAAENEELPTNLKGIYTDGFISLDKSDVTHKEWDASVDIDFEYLTVPFNETDTSLLVSENDSTYSLTSDIYSAPYSSVLAFSQSLASSAMLVNPYSVYQALSVLTLEPAFDNWIDASSYTVNLTETKTSSLRRWWYHRGSWWAENERQQWQKLIGTGGSSVNDGTSVSSNVSVTKEVVLDEAIMYMRQISIVARGSNFEPNSDNIVATFDGQKVQLSPLEGTEAGTITGSVKADANGRFKCSFIIPKNVACGTVKVEFSSPWNKGDTSFTSTGRKVVTKETILTTTNVVEAYDPLAQTFSFSEDTVLTKLGLFFSTKDPSKDVVIQIRNTDNGYPGLKCYAEVVLSASDVKVSNNASVETVVTLPKLIHCEADVVYSIVVASDSNLYSMYVAELGKVDTITGNTIGSNPYAAGVLFSSSNAQTWSAHQTSDLKFNLYKAKFQTKGSLVFNKVTLSNISRFLLAADYYNPFNNKVFYYYSVDDADWQLINPYTDTALTKLGSNFSFKVEFEASENFSPLFSLGGHTFVAFADNTRGVYISKNIVLDEPYTKLRVIFNAYLPSGTSAAVYYATDTAGKEWVQLTDPSIKAISTVVSRYEYLKDLSIPAKAYRIKIVLTTNSSLVIPWISKLMNILKI